MDASQCENDVGRTCHSDEADNHETPIYAFTIDANFDAVAAVNAYPPDIGPVIIVNGELRPSWTTR